MKTIAASPFRWAFALATLLLVELGLRTVGVARLGALLNIRIADNGSDVVERTPLPWWAKARIDRVRRVVAWWPFEGRCLREAMAVALVLRRFDPVVCIGVARSTTGRLNAHAWVAVGGLTYDAEAFHYAPLLPVARS